MEVGEVRPYPKSVCACAGIVEEALWVWNGNQGGKKRFGERCIDTYFYSIRLALTLTLTPNTFLITPNYNQLIPPIWPVVNPFRHYGFRIVNHAAHAAIPGNTKSMP